MNIRKFVTSWYIWIIAALVIGYLFIYRVNDPIAYLPLGLLLLCPIMMMFMMGGHKHK